MSRLGKKKPVNWYIWCTMIMNDQIIRRTTPKKQVQDNKNRNIKIKSVNERQIIVIFARTCTLGRFDNDSGPDRSRMRATEISRKTFLLWVIVCDKSGRYAPLTPSYCLCEKVACDCSGFPACTQVVFLSFVAFAFRDRDD